MLTLSQEYKLVRGCIEDSGLKISMYGGGRHIGVTGGLLRFRCLNYDKCKKYPYSHTFTTNTDTFRKELEPEINEVLDHSHIKWLLQLYYKEADVLSFKQVVFGHILDADEVRYLNDLKDSLDKCECSKEMDNTYTRDDIKFKAYDLRKMYDLNELVLFHIIGNHPIRNYKAQLGLGL